MRKICVTLLHPFTPRAVLYTGLLQKLARSGVTVIVFVPEEKLSFYSQAPYAEGLILTPILSSEYSVSLVHKIKSLFEYGIHTNIKNFHAQELRAQGASFFSHVIRNIWMHTVGRSHLLKYILRNVFSSLTRQMKTGIEHHLPDDAEVLLSTDIYNEHDLLFIRAAQQKGIYVVGMVRSWDNNVSKLLLPYIPDHILSQNNIQTDELIHTQGVQKNIITAVGIPYYEYYSAYTPVSREHFLEHMGLPQDARVILFSPAGEKFISHDWQFCQILKEAIQDGPLPSNTYVLVRCHPGNPCDLSQFTPDEHFIIERPGVIIDAARGNKGAELDMAATNHLIDEITHADVVINILSSIIIDAAVIGTPVITPRFEGTTSFVSVLRSIKRFQVEENMLTLLTVWNGSTPQTRMQFVEEILRVLKGNSANDISALGRIITHYGTPPQEKSHTATEKIFRILSQSYHS